MYADSNVNIAHNGNATTAKSANGLSTYLPWKLTLILILQPTNQPTIVINNIVYFHKLKTLQPVNSNHNTAKEQCELGTRDNT